MIGQIVSQSFFHIHKHPQNAHGSVNVILKCKVPPLSPIVEAPINLFFYGYIVFYLASPVEKWLGV